VHCRTGRSERFEFDLPTPVATFHAKGHFSLAASSHVSPHIHPICVAVLRMS